MTTMRIGKRSVLHKIFNHVIVQFRLDFLLEEENQPSFLLNRSVFQRQPSEGLYMKKLNGIRNIDMDENLRCIFSVISLECGGAV